MKDISFQVVPVLRIIETKGQTQSSNFAISGSNDLIFYSFKI